MKVITKLNAILLIGLFISCCCKKDDDSTFNLTTEPTNDIEGNLWVQSENNFTELNLKDSQETNSFTTLNSFQCTEFDGKFICSQGSHSETKTLMQKGSFNGELIWKKDYVANSEHYYTLNAIEVHQNTVFVGHSIIDKNTYASTYYLEALDLDTGSVNWNIEVENEIKRITSLEGQIITELSIGSSTRTFKYKCKHW